MEALTRIATRANNSMSNVVEALTRLKTGGRQRIEVHYVQVAGNAVIGNGTKAVFADGGGQLPNGNRPLGPEGLACLAVEGRAAVPGKD
jgi:hypothetical protein